jgi:hypothetical protein
VSVHDACAIAWHMPFDDEQYHRLLSAAGLSELDRTMQKRLEREDRKYSRRLWGNTLMAARCALSGLPSNPARRSQAGGSGALIQRQPER